MKAVCGAKTRKGGSCQAPARENGKCRLHGGATPKGSQNAIKHGIYSSHFTEEEQEIASSVILGNVDEELRLCRIRLRRTLAAEHAAKGQPELDETTYRDAPTGSPIATREEKHKVRDYCGIVERILARIESLEKTRGALLAAAGGGNLNLEDEITRDDTIIAPDAQIPEKPIL